MSLYTTLIWVVHAFPIVLQMLNSLPDAVIMRLTPGVKGFLGMKSSLAVQIDQILKDPDLLESADHETIYHHLMTPQPTKGQPNIPSRKSLLEEVRTPAHEWLNVDILSKGTCDDDRRF